VKAYPEKFCPVVRDSGFFSIWSKQVKAKLGPETMVNLLLEHLRADRSDERYAFCMMISFMQVNPFPEFLKAIFDYITNEELDDFGTAGNGAFYDQMVKLITMQIEEYWKAFEVQQQGKSKELLENSDGHLRAKIRNILLELLPDDGGEDWKRGIR